MYSFLFNIEYCCFDTLMLCLWWLENLKKKVFFFAKEEFFLIL